jgi:hypothetical protein
MTSGHRAGDRRIEGRRETLRVSHPQEVLLVNAWRGLST